MLLSINQKVIGKSPEAVRRFNSAFDNLDVTGAELAKIVQTGYAFCAQHRAPRRGANFIQAGFLAVDIDGGLTVAAAKAHPFFVAYATLLYTTASHTEENHRFRIVFELEEPIKDRRLMRDALSGLVAKFGGDQACTDECRVFFGSPGCAYTLHGKSLPPEAVQMLAQQAAERAVARRAAAPGASGSTVRSRISLPVGLEVKCADGQRRPIESIQAHTRVYCPQHVDQSPSAFVTLTRSGTPCVHCSACQATFFMDGYRPPSSDYFDYSWTDLLGEMPAISSGSTSNQCRPAGKSNFTVLVTNSRFVPDMDTAVAVLPPPAENAVFDMGPQLPAGLYVDCGVALVSSQKGTGKTELLTAKIRRWKAAGVGVLAISHRRSLLFALAERLGLTNYLEPTGGWNAPQLWYSVCIDSLGKLDPSKHKYEVVVLDECEQVFAHLLSPTMREKRREIIMVLRHYLRAATQIVLLDADLGKLSLDLVEAFTEGQDRASELLLNIWKPENAILHVYNEATPSQLVGELVRSLCGGQRCYVCCNSKADVDRLSSQIPKHVLERPLRMISVTSDTVQLPDVQTFIRNVAREILNYDLVISSPSMSTGIDITFPDCETHVDVVYGIFRPLITTHLEIDQQLARVRHPGDVRVWISPEEFEFETDPGAIEAEILASEATHHIRLGINEGGQPEYLKDPLYDAIFSSVTAMQRSSKNCLRRHFLHYKERQNWKISPVPYDRASASLGGRILNAGTKELRAADSASVMSAPVITRQDYEQLDSQGRRSSIPAERLPEMRRFELEAFYGQAVTEALVEFDDRGHGRSRVRNFLALLATEDEVQALERWDSDILIQDRWQWAYRKKVLDNILTAAGLFDGAAFKPGARVDSTSLKPFLLACDDEKVALERLFKLTPRADRQSKPVLQLNAVLDLVGLKVTRVGRVQSGGQDRVLFCLQPAALATMIEHVRMRRERLQRMAGKVT